MSKNEYLSLVNATGWIIKLYFSLSMLITYVGYAIIIYGYSYSSEVRSFLVALLSLPSFLFLTAVYLYERRVIEPVLKRFFYVGVIISIAFLLLPAIFLVFRYQVSLVLAKWISCISTLILTSSIVMLLMAIFKKPSSDNISIQILTFIRTVMWEHWEEYEVLNDTFFNHNLSDIDIINRRADYYADKESLEIFQKTLTCQEIDAFYSSKLLLESGNLPKTLTVLDIGGGDGLFTYNFLKYLQAKNHEIVEVTMNDPVDWGAEYKQTISEILPSERISITREKFTDLDLDMRYDLVISSHSLYATFDQIKKDCNARDISSHLLSFLKPSGFAVILMASRRGLSYQFKKRALNSLFGKSIEDSVVEVLQRAFSKNIVSETYIDNLINLTELIKDYEVGGYMIENWLSYFLRYDITGLPKSGKTTLIRLLLDYVHSIDAMSEVDQATWLALETPTLGRECSVLMHKTKALILSNC